MGSTPDIIAAETETRRAFFYRGREWGEIEPDRFDKCLRASNLVSEPNEMYSNNDTIVSIRRGRGVATVSSRDVDFQSIFRKMDLFTTVERFFVLISIE